MGRVGRQPFDASHQPLARLFALAYRQLIDALHVRLIERGWPDVREAYGFVLLAARDQAVTVTDVANLMGTTKQAASVLVAGMRDTGYLEADQRAADGRVRPLVLTARARELLGVVEDIYAELEAEWADGLGERRVETIRRDVAAALHAAHGDRLPVIRPTA
jgi:DNA-binding MarR family transcriptional regulator